MKTSRGYRSSVNRRILAVLSLVVLGTSLSGCIVYPGRGGYRVEPLIAFRSPIVVR